MKEGEVPHEVSALSGAFGEVFVGKGEAIPLGGEAAGDGNGLWRT